MTDVHSNAYVYVRFRTKTSNGRNRLETGETTHRHLLCGHHDGQCGCMRSQRRFPNRNHRMVVGAEHETSHCRFRKGKSRHPRYLEEHKWLRQSQQRHSRRLRHSRRGAIGILCVAPVRGKRPAGGDYRTYRRVRRFLHARYVGFGAAERPRVRPSHGFRSNGVLLQRQRVRAGRHRCLQDSHVGRLLRGGQKAEKHRRVHRSRFG